MRAWVRRLAGAILSSGLLLGAAPASSAAASISLSAAPAQIRAGQTVTLSGQVAGAPAGTAVNLFVSPYPYRHPDLLATVAVSAAGAFSYNTTPERNATYQAKLSDGSASPRARVVVRYRTITRVRAITLGRAEVTVLVFHPAGLHWNRAPVRWSFGGAHGGLRVSATNRSRRLGPHITVLRMTIALPAGRFRFLACFTPPQQGAIGDPDQSGKCRGRGYRGGGRLPAGFPSAAAIARAERALGARRGRTGFAVIDSEGRLSGVNVHARFITGSVVKAMLLVAYLRRLNALGQHHIDSHSASFLYPMIHVSDNNAASETMSYVGASGLYGVARAAGMRNFYVAGSAPGDWGSALLSPADQARFFFEMDSLIPKEFVGYARYLLSTIASYESWGIPAVARPLGYRVFFKGGWRPTPSIYLVNQIARLEGHHHTFAMAVMTDGDPDMGYGIGTIQAVTSALLR
jgi:hypothetical protein